MSGRQRNVSETELAVLQALWRHGRSTVRDLTDEVYGDQTFSKYQSVQKLLERLENKGCVKRDRSSSAHTFEATVDRAELLGQSLEEVAKKLCDGSMTPLLMHLLRHTRLKPSERKALRKLIDGDKR